jgi:hypothetical protein
VARLRVGNLPKRRLVVRFVCYLIVIKSLSFCYLFGLTLHDLVCYVVLVSL